MSRPRECARPDHSFDADWDRDERKELPENGYEMAKCEEYD
jgi:hypothetical protein